MADGYEAYVAEYNTALVTIRRRVFAIGGITMVPESAEDRERRVMARLLSHADRFSKWLARHQLGPSAQ